MGKHSGLVTRLIFRTGMAGVAVGIGIVISWAIASNTVGGVLGSPPPEMGDGQTTFLWRGAAQLPGRPRAWRFTYVRTHIPATPTVRIYVSPLGRLLRTEPADLARRIKVWQQKGFS